MHLCVRCVSCESEGGGDFDSLKQMDLLYDHRDALLENRSVCLVYQKINHKNLG